MEKINSCNLIKIIKEYSWKKENSWSRIAIVVLFIVIDLKYLISPQLLSVSPGDRSNRSVNGYHKWKLRGRKLLGVEVCSTCSF